MFNSSCTGLYLRFIHMILNINAMLSQGLYCLKSCISYLWEYVECTRCVITLRHLRAPGPCRHQEDKQTPAPRHPTPVDVGATAEDLVSVLGTCRYNITEPVTLVATPFVWRYSEMSFRWQRWGGADDAVLEVAVVTLVWGLDHPHPQLVFPPGMWPTFDIKKKKTSHWPMIP